MTILLLTSTGRRHLRFAARLSGAFPLAYLFVVAEVIRPSPWPRAYQQRVWNAEQRVFADAGCLTSRMEIVSHAQDTVHMPIALRADAIIVFGSGLIREPLLSHCMARRAVNLHAGISPFYRGNACNFWATYDGHPEYVGATIHRLSPGVDAGDILETVPAPEEPDPFLRGMLAVRAGQDRLIAMLQDGSIWQPGTPQDLSQTIRYSKRADFTDAVALEFLNRNPI